MSLYIDRNKLKIMHGETKYDYANHKYIPDGPAQDVTKEMLKLMYNYFVLAVEKREKNGQQASFQISSPNTPYVLQMIKTDMKKSDFIPVFEVNDFPTTIDSLSEVIKKSSKSVLEESNIKQEKYLMSENMPAISDNNNISEIKDTSDNTEVSLETKPKRHRRTKAEMMAAREAEAKKAQQLSFIDLNKSDNENIDTKKRGRKKNSMEE